MGGCCSSPAAEATLQQEQEEQDATGGLVDMYEVKHLLGSGSAGDTWLCRDKFTGELLAVKLMKRPLPRVMGANIMREVKIGAQLGKGHLNIVKPKELILTRTHLGIVMEYVAGGNMADYILKTILLKFGSFDTRDGLVMEEDEARYFFTQVINAVEYCHRNKVAHRDLKMDNTLLDDNDPPRIKLCDFGFAKWWTDKPCMSTITGTPDYMSPELLGAKALHRAQALYDGTKADIWAAGVMLCVMLIGRFPFEGIEMSNATNLEEVSEHVWHQQNSARWYDNPLITQDCIMLSPECMDLLNQMFTLDSDKRITIPEIRQHTWFMKPLPPPYSVALAEMYRDQRKIDEQVKSGAFVSNDRDQALARMIEASSVRHSPEQEHALLQQHQQEQAAAAAHQGGGQQSANFLMRKISLSSIQPFQLDAAGGEVDHVSLCSLSDRFKQHTSSDGRAALEGQQQQQQQADGDSAAVQQSGGQQQQLPSAQVQQNQQQQQQAAGLEIEPLSQGQKQQPMQAQQQLPPPQQQDPTAPSIQQQQAPLVGQQHSKPLQQQQQQQQPFSLQPLPHTQNSSSSSSNPSGLVGSAVREASQSHNTWVTPTDAPAAPTAAAAELPNNPLRQVSIGEIQVT